MRKCPLCNSEERVDYPFRTYKTCQFCQHTYQPEPPSKTWLNPESEYVEGYRPNGAENSTMGEQEKAINAGLASWLYNLFKPKKTLDIGCAYPYFANCFKSMGAEAIGVDGVYKIEGAVNNDLPVTTLGVDWEDLEDGGYNTWGGTDLITMIHVLEHFIDPIACLKRAYDNLADDGILYIRTPNKNVEGIDRDHTEGHILIHPNIFGNESLMYAAKKVGFHPLWLEHMAPYGQTSWIFKKKRPKISLFMIVKDEEKNIVDCLNSVNEFCDEMIVLDTGSTDSTVEKAISAGALVYKSKHFNSNTEIKDFNFAQARNEAMEYASGDWLFWMDADDRFYCDQLDLFPELDAYYVNIKYGSMNLTHSRFFRNNWGVNFKGAVHEFAAIDGCRNEVHQGCYIKHLCEDRPGRIGRNISILETEYQKNPNDSRTKFYLANAYRENAQLDDAIKIYRDYIDSGGGWHDEIFLTKFYLMMCYYTQSKLDIAISEGHRAIAFSDKWAEPYNVIGECYYFKGEYQKAIYYLKIAMGMPLPQTTLFVEKDRYDRIPKLWLSHCYEALGDLCEAKKWAKGTERVQELENRTHVIELHRPGALGDVLCTTPVIRELRKKHPKSHIRFVTHSSAVPILEHNPDIDEIVAGECNKYSDQKIYFQYPMDEGYPHTPMDKHITKCFAENAKVQLPIDWAPHLRLLPDDLVKLEHKKPIITFAVRTGWSRYKEWPLDRWEKLVQLFPEYQFIQLGAKGETEIPGAQHMCGKLTLRESFSVLQQSALFVGLDSVFNHVSKALEVPAIIIFGSTSPTGHGYESQVNLWSGFECSPCYREDNSISAHPKSPCPYEHKCMVDFMTVERVSEAVNQKLNIKYAGRI